MNLPIGDKNKFNFKTPDSILNYIKERWGEFFDPCPLFATFDGLNIEWKKLNYCNPPFDNIEGFLEKTIFELAKGNTTIFLCPIRSNTKYWKRYVYPYASEYILISEKVKFISYEDNGEASDKKNDGFPIPIVMLVFDPKRTPVKNNSIAFSLIPKFLKIF